MEVVQQKGHAMPPHLAALVMEIKVVVLDFRVIEELDILLEGNTHGAFVSAFVDEIDNELRSVKRLLRVEMLAERVFLKNEKNYERSENTYCDSKIHSLDAAEKHLRSLGSQRSGAWGCT